MKTEEQKKRNREYMARKRAAWTPEEREANNAKARQSQRKYRIENRDEYRRKGREREARRIAENPALREHKRLYAIEWRKRNPDYAAAYNAAYGDRRRAWYFQKHYGLSMDEYETLVADGCQICGSTEKLCVDHDHDSGEVRGALCMACNSGIGQLRDDPDLVERALAYLRAA